MHSNPLSGKFLIVFGLGGMHRPNDQDEETTSGSAKTVSITFGYVAIRNGKIVKINKKGLDNNAPNPRFTMAEE